MFRVTILEEFSGQIATVEVGDYDLRDYEFVLNLRENEFGLDEEDEFWLVVTSVTILFDKPISTEEGQRIIRRTKDVIDMPGAY